MIDFEYALPTPRGLDLANFFNEFCFDYDGEHPEVPDTTKYPSPKFIYQLLKEYLGVPDEDLIRRVHQEIVVYLPIVCLLWGYWSLVKAAEGGISDKFNYLKSAYERFKLANYWIDQMTDREC